MQVICIPILVYYFNSPKLKRLSTIFLTLNLTLLFITGARGALISVLIIFILGYILRVYSITTLKKLIYCIAMAIILFIINSLYFSSNSSIEYTLRTTSSGRVEIWLDLISNLKFKNVFIGNGAGAYKNEVFNVSHPHNSILQILYNWGA
ncbi:MAG: O-antigen ligase family protein, partial [Pseudoalteromonas sp.]